MKIARFCATLGLLLSAVSITNAQQSSDQPDHSSPPIVLVTPGGTSSPMTPERQARMDHIQQVNHDAAVALHAGRYAVAEAEARQSIALQFSGVPEEILAQALEAQGREQEALQAYHWLAGGREARNLLPYALLLLKSGRWAQAVAAYNAALPTLPDAGAHRETPTLHDEEVIRANGRFSPDTPDSVALATAIHIARGLVYNATPDWAHESQNTEALAEYAKALQLAPDSPLTNYYYGTGWQELSPAERAKVGSVQQAKAALQKAIQTGKGDVKKAAEKALKDLSKPAAKPA